MNKDWFNGPVHDPNRSLNIVRMVVAFILSVSGHLKPAR
jgi:hypothetical protein